MLHLKRQSRTDEYGFELKSLRKDKIYIVMNVRPDSEAHRAGLCDGNVIVEKNGRIVEDDMKHEMVVQKISSNPHKVDLLVMDDAKQVIEGILIK